MIIMSSLEIAVTHHRAGRLAEALQVYRSVLADDPDNVDALHLAGVALNRLGHPQEAVEMIERAASLGRPKANMLFNLANAYRFAGRTEEAVTSYKAALADDPEMESAHGALWETLHAAGRVKTIVIAASDGGFFDLTRDLMLSIEDCRSGDTAFDIGFLDAGCDREQLAWLERRGVQVVPITDGPAFRAPDKPVYTMAHTCRPHLREYFPGYDVYFWLDADTWIQDQQAVSTFVSQAIRSPRGVVAVREIDTGYVTLNRSSAAQAYYGAYHARCASFCPPELMQKLVFVPMFNAGVFAMHKDSHGWDAWSRHLDMALVDGFTHMIDQYALNTALAELGKVANLPPTYNWISSQCTPFRNDRGKVCKPYHPYEELNIIHLTASSQTFDGVKFMDLYRERRLVYEAARTLEPVIA